jgi:hypothetical protein
MKIEDMVDGVYHSETIDFVRITLLDGRLIEGEVFALEPPGNTEENDWSIVIEIDHDIWSYLQQEIKNIEVIGSLKDS